MMVMRSANPGVIDSVNRKNNNHNAKTQTLLFVLQASVGRKVRISSMAKPTLGPLFARNVPASVDYDLPGDSCKSIT